MRDVGAQRWILDRNLHNEIQFALRGARNDNGAVNPIPLRERFPLNVVGQGLCRLVNRVRSEVAYRLPNWNPRIVGRGF
jgi:hypothetical protein